MNLLTPPLPFLPRFLQFLIALGPDGFGAAFQLVERCQVADRAVQANSVVMADVARQQTLRLFDRRRHARSETFPFERLMPALDLAVRLRIEGRSPHMGHAADSNELLEIPSDELRPVVGDDARAGLRKFLPRPLQN